MAQTSVYVDSSTGIAKPAHAATLDAARYTSADFMKREWDGLWTRVWLLAALESDLTEVGDFVTFEIGRESIIITRSAPGTLSAVSNACQHRGNRITTLERGSVAALACPYHGWTYALDGTLSTVPDADRFKQGLPCSELSLKPVRVETWAGQVWINMDPDAIALRDYLGDVTTQLEAYHFETMTLVRDQTLQLDSNWKTLVDNFNEQYHVDFIHPQHRSYVNCSEARNELFPYGHRRVLTEGYCTDPRYPVPEEAPAMLHAALKPLGLDANDFHGRVNDIRPAVQRQKRALGGELGIDYTHFADNQLSDVWQYDLFPNIIMPVRTEEMWVMRVRPHPTDPDKCFFDKWTLQRLTKAGSPLAGGLSLVGMKADGTQQDMTERPEREVFTQDEIIAGRISMNLTVDQDVHYLRDMQAGMHSRGFKQAWLSEDESRVQHFHDWVDTWMNSTTPILRKAGPYRQTP